MGQFVDLTGHRFGRLLVTSTFERRKRLVYWLCVCDCGKTKFVGRGNLQIGRTVSCGCRMHETIAERVRLNTTHGQSAKGGTRTFHIYNHMKQRCHNPSNPAYKDYGGRGIKVCRRWLHSFDNFYADMGDCPPGKSIERRNNSKGYSKSNCKWATPKEQANNRRPKSKRWNKYLLTFNGETKTISEWSQTIGIAYATIWLRWKHGWPMEDVLKPKRFTPYGRRSNL